MYIVSCCSAALQGKSVALAQLNPGPAPGFLLLAQLLVSLVPPVLEGSLEVLPARWPADWATRGVASLLEMLLTFPSLRWQSKPEGQIRCRSQ